MHRIFHNCEAVKRISSKVKLAVVMGQFDKGSEPGAL
jgi:hypothetical protein